MKADRILFSAEQIDERVRQLAARIDADTAGGGITIVAVLTGSFIFCADLVRRLRSPLEIETVKASSYAGLQSTGHVEFGSLPGVEGRDVLVVDDIFDSGLTLRALVAELLLGQPACLRTCVLLHKRVHRADGIVPDYVGFEIEPEFVVGYGLDYDGQYRNLPHIAALDLGGDGHGA